MKTVEEYRALEPRLELARKLKGVVWVISVLVMGLVVLMGKVTLPWPGEGVLWFLPLVNAVLNTGVALCLVAALLAIKGGKPVLHRQLMWTAFRLSALFLICYVVYHFTSGETKFGDVDRDGVISPAEGAEVGNLRVVYLLTLISHIVLAALSFPFILMTFVYAITHQFEKHRRMARWVYPAWLYVALTGPICYLLLRPYY